jgi:hypothetical protein
MLLLLKVKEARSQAAADRVGVSRAGGGEGGGGGRSDLNSFEIPVAYANFRGVW